MKTPDLNNEAGSHAIRHTFAAGSSLDDASKDPDGSHFMQWILLVCPGNVISGASEPASWTNNLRSARTKR